MRKVLILIAMTVATFGAINSAEARHRHYNPSKKIHTDLINTTVASTTTTLSAKRVRLGHRRACDGVHGCTCGTTQARLAGLPLNYNGFNLKLAKDWARALPHTSAQPGAVVVQNRGGIHGHVSRIVQNTGNCRAIVQDEKGQYERDICSRLVAYVSPGGGTGDGYSTPQVRTRYASRRHSRYTQVANLNYGYDPTSIR